MTRVLSTLDQLPTFSNINPADIKATVEQAIENCKTEITRVLSQVHDFTWQNLVEPIDEVDDTLSKLWSPISHMNSVVNSEELRAAYESCLPLLSEYGTFVGQHQELFKAYQQLANSEHYQTLDVAQKKVIDDALRDFTLSGIALNDEDKQRYGEIVTRLSALSSTFSNNVLDATHSFTLNIENESELSGLPASAIEAAKQLAESKALSGWLFTLDFPSYFPVITYCDDQNVREKIYQAFVTRASEQGPDNGKFDNSDIMNEILQLRHELSILLGFENYAQKSIATKMAMTTDEVLGFLKSLATKSYDQGKEDLQQVVDFAAENYGKAKLNAWDLPYYSEKLKQSRYAISDEELRPYFPEQKVVNGLFEVVKRLFGIVIEEQTGIDTWHKDVKFYHVYDKNQQMRGSFYLDLYAREHKRGGAWMDDCMGRRALANGDIQLPVAYLTCNFNKPVGDKPALFTHNEVETLFHEFGHGIHHMLTQIDASSVAGINGVPWDAVELPSQFLENWCWEPEALAFISGHYQTNEALPKSLLDKMLAAKNFQSAMQMLRQIEFSLFDFTMHADYKQEESTNYIQQTLNKVRSEYAVVNAPEFNRFQHSFGHIFGGGYAAGYYSYKWAEVLSADAFSRFEEQGVFNADVGRDFLENILEKGGSEEPSVLFERFRGRAPTIDALLKHSGIQH